MIQKSVLYVICQMFGNFSKHITDAVSHLKSPVSSDSHLALVPTLEVPEWRGQTCQMTATVTLREPGMRLLWEKEILPKHKKRCEGGTMMCISEICHHHKGIRKAVLKTATRGINRLSAKPALLSTV